MKSLDERLTSVFDTLELMFEITECLKESSALPRAKVASHHLLSASGHTCDAMGRNGKDLIERAEIIDKSNWSDQGLRHLLCGMSRFREQTLRRSGQGNGTGSTKSAS